MWKIWALIKNPNLPPGQTTNTCQKQESAIYSNSYALTEDLFAVAICRSLKLFLILYKGKKIKFSTCNLKPQILFQTLNKGEHTTYTI